MKNRANFKFMKLKCGRRLSCAGGEGEGRGLKPKDLAYQSGTDGKLQVSIKRQQSFVRAKLPEGGKKSWRQKARIKNKQTS